MGTIMNTAPDRDMMRAMARPLKQSLAKADTIMRGPDAPIPCKKRPTSIISKDCADIANIQPSIKKAKPT